MSESPTFRRRKYLVKKSLQIKYIVFVLFFAFLVAFLTGYTIYQTSITVLGDKLARVYPQGQLMDIFKATNIIVLFNFILIAPVIIIFALIFSHRIAGPLYNIEKVLREISKGNLGMKVKLRKKDELKDVEEVINAMVDNLRGMTVSNKQKAEATLEKIREIKTFIRGDATMEAATRELAHKLDDIENLAMKLNEDFKKYMLE